LADGLGTKMTKRSDFDLDLAAGHAGEKLVEELLTGGNTVEVKRDFKWKETGNLYIETACWSSRKECWYDSGLSTTKADYWAFVLGESTLLVPASVLVLCVLKYGEERSCDIPPDRSIGYLITPQNILDTTRLIGGTNGR